MQKHINKARLMEVLEEVNIQYLNTVGVDINLVIDHEHMYNITHQYNPRTHTVEIFPELCKPINDWKTLSKQSSLPLIRISHKFVYLNESWQSTQMIFQKCELSSKHRISIVRVLSDHRQLLEIK